MGNDSSKNKKVDESIVKQLQSFGYQRDQIIVAMQCVKNPKDINEIVEWLEKRAQNGPSKQYSPQTYQSSSYQSSPYQQQSSYAAQQKAAEQERLRQERLRQERLRQQRLEEQQRQERLRQQRLREQQEQERLRQQRLRQQQQQNRAVVPYGGGGGAQDDNKDDDDDGADEFMAFLGALVSLSVVEQHGFVLATEKHRIALIRALAMVQCQGATALRDAVLTGVILMLELKGVLLKLGALKHKFVHIVLTDGADTSSEASVDDLKVLFFKLGMEIGDLCKTFFVGVGLGWKEKKELDDIARLAGDSAETLNCNDVELEKVFDRIQVKLGIQRQVLIAESGGVAMIAAKDQLVAEVSENKFLVLFTLDTSGSMAGARWEKVVRAVAGFCAGMKDHDILGCILFNNKAQLITK